MSDELTPIKKIAVIGAGTMGVGIAASSAMSGFAVTVNDVNEELLGRARRELANIVEVGVARGKVSESTARQVFETLDFTIHIEDIAESDLIIEAIPERFDLKQVVFEEIDARAHKRTILATNTSSLSVNVLASVTNRPDRFVDMHFSIPPTS